MAAMLTDWMIVRRLAAELNRTVRGARIRQAGLLAGDRFGLNLGSQSVNVDPFAQTPIVTLEPPAPLGAGRGWVRTFADALEGLRIEAVTALAGDRVILFDCASRSRFGVESGYRLVAELVPRFGNLLLLKGDTVVAAVKEFEAGGSTRRTIAPGAPYEPPPPPSRDITAPPLEAEVASFAAGDRSESAFGRAARALRADLPVVPRLVADSLIAQASHAQWRSAEALAVHLRAEALALLAQFEQQGVDAPVFVYRDDGRIVQFHVVRLQQLGSLDEAREDSLLRLTGTAIGVEAARRASHAFGQRRNALAARVAKRRAALGRERELLERERDDAAARERLRTWGELLYAHLGEVPAGAAQFVPPSDPSVLIELDPSIDVKANAQAIFKRYKKAVAKRTHVERRLSELALEEAFAEELAWEVERVEPETLDDAVEAADRLERRKARRAAPVRRRRPLEVSLAADARVLVGRSPQSNADLTFRTAHPDDLWFHARQTPGAHVILRIDSKREPQTQELEAAAELAAYYSKARLSAKVAVDYTQRKHVRRQQGAAPGLVWYTNARTLLVSPRTPPA
jgi:predicted ribosome quality control (RQC) complex YloA/Tae2 family protein